MDTLYWYYVQSKKNNDVVGKIVKLFSNNGNKLKTRISIIQQLLQQVSREAVAHREPSLTFVFRLGYYNIVGVR